MNIVMGGQNFTRARDACVSCFYVEKRKKILKSKQKQFTYYKYIYTML